MEQDLDESRIEELLHALKACGEVDYLQMQDFKALPKQECKGVAFLGVNGLIEIELVDTNENETGIYSMTWRHNSNEAIVLKNLSAASAASIFFGLFIANDAYFHASSALEEFILRVSSKKSRLNQSTGSYIDNEPRKKHLDAWTLNHINKNLDYQDLLDNE